MQGMPPNQTIPMGNPAQPLPESFSQNPVGAEIGLWPLAWGWWVVTALSIIILVGLVFWIRHYREQRAYLRMAVKEIESLDVDEAQLKPACNEILKRTFMSYFPVEAIAKLHGDKWALFLKHQLSSKQQVTFAPYLNQLGDGFYQNKANTKSEMTAQEFVTSSARLLKQTLPPSKKQLQSALPNSHLGTVGGAQ